MIEELEPGPDAGPADAPVTINITYGGTFAMKKRLLAALTAALLLMSALSGCGSDRSASSGNAWASAGNAFASAANANPRG